MLLEEWRGGGSESEVAAAVRSVFLSSSHRLRTVESQFQPSSLTTHLPSFRERERERERGGGECSNVDMCSRPARKGVEG